MKKDRNCNMPNIPYPMYPNYIPNYNPMMPNMPIVDNIDQQIDMINNKISNLERRISNLESINSNNYNSGYQMM